MAAGFALLPTGGFRTGLGERHTTGVAYPAFPERPENVSDDPLVRAVRIPPHR
jgi:hypothetical protein